MENKSKLRIALIINNIPENGGANSYEASFIQTFKKINNNDIYFEIFYTDFNSKVFKNVNSSDFYVRRVKVNLLIKFRLLLEMSLLISSLLSRISIFKTKFEKLIKKKFDVIIFLSPNPLALLIKEVPLVTTVWDLGHRDLPFLSEFQLKNNFREREFYYLQTVSRSMLVLVDSETTKNSIIKLYGADSDRTLVTGLLPRNLIKQETKIENEFSFDYIFYPAQFWSHKNHIRLIAAFKKILLDFPNLKLVLTGSDKGSLAVIKKLIQEMELTNQVDILGFVDQDKYWEILKNCQCLVFPSILGPTNIPTLEAAILGKRMAVSQFHEKYLCNFGVTATYFDPYSVDSIAEAILSGLRELKDYPPVDFTNNNQSAILNLLNQINKYIT